jgi:hypothetical protein
MPTARTEIVRLKSIIGDEYVAGMWRGNLVSELLWVPMLDPLERCVRPKKYRRPSFSCVSVDGPIGHHLENNTEFGALATVLEVSISRFCDDEMGMVTGASLILHSLSQAKLSQKPSRHLGVEAVVQFRRIS